MNTQEMKYTPGPWMVRRDANCFIENEEKRLAIITNAAGDWETDEGIANAFLISAAPDMLIALKQSLEAMQVVWGTHGDSQYHNNIILVVMRAISKAEGRS